MIVGQEFAGPLTNGGILVLLATAPAVRHISAGSRLAALFQGWKQNALCVDHWKDIV